mgnify:CR=1 FL=1
MNWSAGPAQLGMTELQNVSGMTEGKGGKRYMTSAKASVFACGPGDWHEAAAPAEQKREQGNTNTNGNKSNCEDVSPSPAACCWQKWSRRPGQTAGRRQLGRRAPAPRSPSCLAGSLQTSRPAHRAARRPCCRGLQRSVQAAGVSRDTRRRCNTMAGRRDHTRLRPTPHNALAAAD